MADETRSKVLPHADLDAALQVVSTMSPVTARVLREHVAALTADNAALVNAIMEWEDGNADAEMRARVLAKQPHPGAALLERLATAERRVQELERPVRAATALLPAIHDLRTPGHAGDEETGQHDEDCEACRIDAVKAMAEEVASVQVAALAPSAAVERARALLKRAKVWPTCKHKRRGPDFGCLDCGGEPSEREWETTVADLLATPPAPAGLLEAVAPFVALARENTHEVMADKDITSFERVHVSDARRLVAAIAAMAEEPKVLADAAPAGLLEAVDAVLESFDEVKGLKVWDDEQDMVNLSECLETLRNQRAAYDAAKGGERTWVENLVVLDNEAKARKYREAVERAKDLGGLAEVAGDVIDKQSSPDPVSDEHLHAALGVEIARYVLGLDAPTGPGGGETAPEPTVSVAALAAVVETYVNETHEAERAGAIYRDRRDDRCSGAREVLRRVTDGQVPEVLEKARVVEVLRDARERHIKAADGHVGSSLEMYHRAMADACTQVATRLGLTLPASEPHAG